LNGPGVSVIVPLYNKAAYVGRCLESILAQEYGDFEAIVVDDGSTDGSADVVRAYKDPRVRLIVQKNAGPGAARNRAAAEARFGWIAPIDSDDSWQPNYLAESIRMSRRYPDAEWLAWAMRELPQETSTATRWKRAGLTEGPWRATPDTRPLLLAGILANMMPSSIVMRRNTFHRMGGFYAKTRCLFGEDTSLWIKLLLNCEVVFSFEALVNRYCDASDLSVNFKGVRPVEPFLMDPEDVRAECPDELRDLLERFLAIRACKTASVYGYFGEHRRAREIMRTFVRPGDWRLPYFFFALVGCTPAGKWLGALTRMARLNLRATHAL
jgi:glycosyltransferase involved in cell wall biosynthesis